MLEGAFTRDEPLSPAELARAKRDLASMQRYGINLVRIDTRAENNDGVRLRQLAQVVSAARQNGHVVLITVSDAPFAAAREWVTYLARRYHGDGSVWLQPMRDPHCTPATFDEVACNGDWARWRSEQRAYLRAIRGEGMHSPVVVSTPGKSRDLRGVGKYPLHDKSVSTASTAFGRLRKHLALPERRLIERLWAGTPANRYAVIADDVGRAETPTRHDRPSWTEEYVAYLADWTSNRGGDGAIARGWRSEPRVTSLVNGSGGLTSWGSLYATRYVALTFPAERQTRPSKLVRGWLQSGDTGRDVRALQRDLAARGYLAFGAINGSYDYATEQGVMAFQGWEGLQRDGTAGPSTRARIAVAKRPEPRVGGPAHVEIDRTKQVLLLVEDGGRVGRAIHVSTGAGGRTPSGDYSVRSKSTYSWSIPFKVWLPYASYFVGGIAMHEYSSVPSYAASHGCVRVPSSESRGVYAFAGMGMRVLVT